jgi:phosphinothricin acetyltransferase
MVVEIRQMVESDWPDVRRIYIEGIKSGEATFATISSISNSYIEWQAEHSSFGNFVAVENDNVVGWSSFSPVSSRCVYSGVVEISIYAEKAQRGKGIGSTLMISAIQAGIFPENEASLKLHERNGFRIVGRREKIGKLEDTWRDTLLLERRSKVTGID